MAEILDQTVGSLTDILRPTFQSLDFRAIAVDVGQDVPQWRLVLGVCVASRAGVKEVSALHQEFLAQSKPPVAKRFQILNRVWPADHLSTLLNEIDEGCLTVGNLALDRNLSIDLRQFLDEITDSPPVFERSGAG